jgi:hypothetical protein
MVPEGRGFWKCGNSVLPTLLAVTEARGSQSRLVATGTSLSRHCLLLLLRPVQVAREMIEAGLPRKPTGR